MRAIKCIRWDRKFRSQHPSLLWLCLLRICTILCFHKPCCVAYTLFSHISHLILSPNFLPPLRHVRHSWSVWPHLVEWRKGGCSTRTQIPASLPRRRCALREQRSGGRAKRRGSCTEGVCTGDRPNQIVAGDLAWSARWALHCGQRRGDWVFLFLALTTSQSVSHQLKWINQMTLSQPWMSVVSHLEHNSWLLF